MDVSASAQAGATDPKASIAYGNGSGSLKAYDEREQKSQDDAVMLSGAAGVMNNAQVLHQAAPVSEANRAQQAVTEINAALKRFATSLQFTIDPATLTRVVNVIDTDTGQTLRQMPTEDAILAARKLDQQKGLFIGQKV